MQIASHRGIGTALPENSVAAFSAAIKSGATVLETDLRTTADGEIVLIHNKSHPGIKPRKLIINETGLDELLDQVRAAGAVLERFGTLYDAFDEVEFILDIKWRSGKETLIALYRWASEQGVLDALQKRALFLVWLPEHVELLTRLFPLARLVANRTQCIVLTLKAVFFRIDPAKHTFYWISIPAIIFRFPTLARRIVRRLEAPRVRLAIYLPTSAGEVICARKLGVNAVMADHPDIWRHAEL